VTVDLERNTSDFKLESLKPKSIEANFKIVGIIDTSKDRSWKEHKAIFLQNVFTNMSTLIAQAKDKTKFTSLSVLKPTEISDFTIEKMAREWVKKKLDKLQAKAQQLNLFKKTENPFVIIGIFHPKKLTQITLF